MKAAVLAAGMATRFGSCKALARYQGRSLLGHVLAALPPQLPTTVVTGAYRAACEAHGRSLAAAPSPLSFRFNPRFKEGIASSLRLAAAFAQDMPLLLTFADLPFVTAADYRRLMAHYERQQVTTFARFGEQAAAFGPPVVFCPADLAKLLTLTGDQGAKKLFVERRDFATIGIPAAARDIDRQEQLYSVKNAQ